MADHLTPDQAARELKVDVSTLRRWRKDKIGPPYVLNGGGRPRYRSDLLRPGSTRLKGLQLTWPIDDEIGADRQHLDVSEVMPIIRRILAD